MMQRKEIHERVLKAADKKELAAAYAEWADHYDQDLLGELGYVAPALACERLLTYLTDPQARILDAGCGTGIVGKFLHQEDYLNLEGLDYSEHMLNKAREKVLYRKLYQADLTAPLDFADGEFDAIISVGTFTCGHVGPEAFNELIRVTRPGGYLCFAVREQAWEEDDYQTTMDRLARQDVWWLQEEKTSDYLQQEGSSCKICVYQKAA
ncbi:MAG TPA: class I SAM-dependent methyltransferase [Pelovirga sp.]|nr:class I SAM-dependent methyltransferase [Pelovirga sp.]